MSARRQYSDKHYLPDNPSWVEFPRSDGDQSTWPSHTTRTVDNMGHVNFMRPVPLDEAGVSIKWRIEVGAALAVLLKWPGMSFVTVKELLTFSGVRRPDRWAIVCTKNVAAGIRHVRSSQRSSRYSQTRHLSVW